MSDILVIIFQILDSYAYLLIASIGLGIIYGMMGIINMAHGEFIMLGAYITAILTKAGAPFIVAVAGAALGLAIFGGLLDLLIMNRLYSRPLDSIGASWGISLIVQQGVLILFGATMDAVTAPFGAVQIGVSTYQIYRLILIGIALIIPILLYLVFNKTRFGLESRTTMQKPVSAGLIGVNTKRIYTITFVLGSALAGLAGGLYSATVSIAPTMGQAFTMQSFVTIVVGGFDPLVGMFEGATALGVVRGVVSLLMSSFYGRMAMLLVAILVIRLFPRGMSGINERIYERRMLGKALGK